MATYSRLGTFIIGGELANDPAGKIYRGLTITGSRFDRHKLIRAFSDELVDAGIGSRFEDAARVATQLAGSRGFASGYHCVGGKTPHIACDHLGGRSLSTLIKKAKQEQIPLGVDHALSVLQGLGQSLALLHTKGFTHGALSPHSVWLTFEGATHIIDAPFAPSLQAVLPKCPFLSRQLEPYRPAQGAGTHQQDFYALGAILYELLTFEVLPAKPHIAEAIRRATLKAAQEEGLVPAELQALLRRLLMVDKPFEHAAAFISELESVLYDGDYSPTTFNMAFFMHTLFREENEADTTAMKADVIADYTPLMEDVAAARKIEGLDTQKYVRFALIGGGLTAIVLGGLFYNSYLQGKRNDQLLARIAVMEEQAKKADERAQAAAHREQQIEEQIKAKEEQAKKGDKNASKEVEALKAQKAGITQEKEKAQQEKAAIQQQAAQAKQVLPEPIRNAPIPVPTTPPQQPLIAQGVPPTVPAAQSIPNRDVPPTVTNPAPQPPPAPPSNVPPSVTPPVSSTPVEAGPVNDTPVEVVNQVQPGWPPIANQKYALLRPSTREWKVTIQTWVDANGRPQKAQIMQDSGVKWGFEEAAEKAALSSTYKPATRNGKPTGGWCVKTFVWRK